MSAPLDVAAHEAGVVRVFALSLTDGEVKALQDSAQGVAEALGTGAPIDMAHAVFVPISDIEEIGLSGYLTEGAGIPADEVAPDKAKLDKLGGWVLVIYSLAFAEQAVTLRPAPSLTLIGTYGQTRTDWSEGDTLSAQSAAPYSAPSETVKKKPSDAAMSGRVATLVLVALAIFTYVFIRIAG